MQTETEDRYADLEKPIEDVREMAQVVAQMAAELANALHARYHGDEDAAAA